MVIAVVEIESLEAISLDNPNDYHDSSHSLGVYLKNESTLEDYSTETSPTSNTQCASQPQTSDNEVRFVTPISQATKPKELPVTESVTGYRSTLTHEASFLLGMLFFKQVLERQCSANQEIEQLRAKYQVSSPFRH